MYESSHKSALGQINSSEIIRDHAADTYLRLNMSQDGGFDR
jgi:hypothetical protein